MEKTIEQKRMHYYEVINLIKKLGEAKGYTTQQKFAEGTGVNQAYISVMMNGRELLPYNQLKKLMEHFEIKMPIIFPWQLN
jgi:transcriptional regulator with XRE-family HTH domain